MRLPRPILAALACVALIGCRGGGILVQSPPDQGVLRGDWVPVVVQVPLEWVDASVVMTLDGEPFEDAMATVRRRKGNAQEPGAQLLATLPLLGLEPGEHLLEIRFQPPGERERRIESRFVTERRQHRVALHVHDGTGRPVNARVVVRDRKGPVRLTDRAAWQVERKRRNADLDAVLVRDGEGEVRLDPGWYRLVATRGLRDAVAVLEIDLDGDTELDLALPRLVETPGVVAADLHVHSALSYDDYTPLGVWLDALACTGLDRVAVTDHNRIARTGRLEDRLAGPAEAPLLVPGIEADMRARVGKNWDWGHLTAWPVAATGAPTSRWPASPAHAVRAWRQRQEEHPHPETGADVLLTLAHPRGILFRTGKRSKDQAWALFNNLGYDRELPVGEGTNAWLLEPAGEGGPTALDFDALEVVNRMGLSKYREVRLDWFALLNQGFRLTGVGNSDSHALAVELVGMPRNLIHAEPGPDGEPDLPALVRAVRQGRVSVTTGPIVDLELVSGDLRAGLGETITPVEGRLRAVVTVRAPPWVPVHELRIVQDGRVVHRVDLGGTTQDDGDALEVVETVELAVDHDGWLLAEAGWPEAADDTLVGGTYSVVAPGYVPFAFTNPVWVDADGDGTWVPPGLRLPAEAEHGE